MKTRPDFGHNYFRVDGLCRSAKGGEEGEGEGEGEGFTFTGAVVSLRLWTVYSFRRPGQLFKHRSSEQKSRAAANRASRMRIAATLASPRYTFTRTHAQ